MSCSIARATPRRRDAAPPMAGLHRHIRHATRLGIVFDWQVQQKADDRLGVFVIRCNDQFDSDAFGAAERFEVR